MKKIVVSTILFLAVLVGCFLYFGYHPERLIQIQLIGLNENNPEADAKKDIETGNLKCYELNGYASYIPTEEVKSDYEYCRSIGIVNFWGTADVIYSDEHGKLINRAFNYAKRYNTVILSKKFNHQLHRTP